MSLDANIESTIEPAITVTSITSCVESEAFYYNSVAIVAMAPGDRGAGIADIVIVPALVVSGMVFLPWRSMSLFPLGARVTMDGEATAIIILVPPTIPTNRPPVVVGVRTDDFRPFMEPS